MVSVRLWRKKIVDAGDAEAFLDYFTRDGNLRLSSDQKQLVVQGLDDVVNESDRDRSWWEVKLGLRKSKSPSPERHSADRRGSPAGGGSKSRESHSHGDGSYDRYASYGTRSSEPEERHGSRGGSYETCGHYNSRAPPREHRSERRDEGSGCRDTRDRKSSRYEDPRRGNGDRDSRRNGEYGREKYANPRTNAYQEKNHCRTRESSHKEHDAYLKKSHDRRDPDDNRDHYRSKEKSDGRLVHGLSKMSIR